MRGDGNVTTRYTYAEGWCIWTMVVSGGESVVVVARGMAGVAVSYFQDEESARKRHDDLLSDVVRGRTAEWFREGGLQ